MPDAPVVTPAPATPNAAPAPAPLITPGNQTSEFTLTKLAMWVGIVTSAVGTADAILQDVSAALSKVPLTATGPALWIALTGAATVVIPAAIFKISRTSLKKTAITAAMAAPASAVQAGLEAA